MLEEIVIQINGGTMINVDVYKRRYLCEKGYVWNPAICNCENGKYLRNPMDDSGVMSKEIIELYLDETNFTEKSNL